MVTDREYWVVANLGGNDFLDYQSLYYLTNNQSKLSMKEFNKHLKKFTEYNIIKCNKSSMDFREKEYALTDKGSKYLDYVNYFWYHNDPSMRYILTDGKTDITLPKEQ